MNSTCQILTERQQREREYYDSYCTLHDETPVNFAPIEGVEKRPWNSYWYSYEEVVAHFHAVKSQEDRTPRLLDFGCGTGQSAISTAKLGYRVSGFDISERQIESARGRAKEFGVQEICDFSVQVAENLEYADNSFDCILGIDILHHLEIEPSIHESYRVLRPGGVAIFREWIEVDAFDRVRETALVRRFFPKGKSIEKHRTEDERKLNREDMRLIRQVFPLVKLRQFGVLSRLCRILPERTWLAASLQRMDHAIFRVAPVVSSLGGEVVLVLRKPADFKPPSAPR